jgi:hypothetical protein
MGFFTKGLNPFKIQSNFKLELSLEFYNSKSRRVWELGQKGNLFYFKLSTTMPSLEIFGHKEDHVLYF